MISRKRRCHHRWATPWRLVGGLRENPGVYGHGAGVLERFVCARCGAHKEEVWEFGRLRSRAVIPLGDLTSGLRENTVDWLDALAEARAEEREERRARRTATK
jgi:hypothetical protein